MKIPFDHLHHTNIVVRDARASADKLARVYGIPDWGVVQFGPERLSSAATHGFAAEHGFKIARGVASTPVGDVVLQLIEPLAGWTTFHEFLLAKGEGIHSMCTAQMRPQDFEALLAWLDDEGIGIAQHDVIDGALTRYQLDTRKALGGFYVEIEVAAEPGSTKLRYDEVWDMSGSIDPDGPLLPLMPTDLSMHFGVVLDDLWSTIREWQRLTGIGKFDVYNWRNDPKSLVDPTYMGRPVDHSYLSTLVQFDPLLGFELIQPTFGPSHYRENYRDQLGEGIHHIAASCLPSADSWQTAADRMAAENVPIVMSGSVGSGYMDFYYLDTREALAGYVTEIVHRGKNYARGPEDLNPEIHLDLSREASALNCAGAT